MPTPFEILMNPISIAALAIFAGLMLWEALAPARHLPAVPGWRLRGLVCFAVFFYLSTYLPLVWDRHLAAFQLLDLTGLGTFAGALAGLLVHELGTYCWHRCLHGFDVLWRGLHQMHHSAERLDTFGAFWFSIPDMIGWTALSSLMLVLVVGVNPQAATIVLLTVHFATILQHANVRTPRWIGYFIQRPEMHSVHHGRGVHRHNYASLPVFDLLFGTFRNPATFAPETGFYDGASSRVLDMHLFRDVSRPQPPTARRAAA